MKLSIVIPFYNEAEAIELTHDTIAQELGELSSIELELVYVNDGSSDKTLQYIQHFAELDSRVKYISFSRNFGKEAAILAGLEHSTGDLTVLMDGDLQHPPYVVKQMIEAYHEGYDIISAKRTREGEKKIPSFFARMFYRVANQSMDISLQDGVSDFRGFSRKALNAILSLREYNRFSKGIFSWVGFKEKVIPYKNEIRKQGQTKFNFSKSMNYAIQGLISFNSQPLRLIIHIGIGLVGLSICYLIWLLIEFFMFKDRIVSGYFTTIFTIIFFGGIQLLSLGVLGEYIGKIYYETKHRPHYIVEETNCYPSEKGEPYVEETN